MGKSTVHPQLNVVNGVEILSSPQIGWQGIVVEHYQAPPNHICEFSPGALLAHWLCFPSPQPIHLVQNHGECWHESIVKQNDLVLVPAGQSTYWRCPLDAPISDISIYLPPELVLQMAASADLNPDRIELIDCFSQSDPHLYQIVNIASQVGFSSQSHLTLHCKNLTGMTPRQISKNRNSLSNRRSLDLLHE